MTFFYPAQPVRCALPSTPTGHDLYSHWYPLYAKLHCLAAACEHMRRSCCPRRVESEVFMRECMCSCSRTYLGHQASPANTKGVSPRSVRPPSSLRRCCTALVPAQTECTHSSSAVQAFRTGSSMGTGGDPSAVPVAHAECVPCKAEERRVASHAVRRFFRIV